MLSVSQLGEADLSFQFDVLSPSYLTDQPYASVKFGGQGATEFWEDIVRTEVLWANDDSVPDSGDPQASDGVLQSVAPFPAIPIDDSVDPFVNGPGLENGFCLPGDSDRNGHVGFLDFLLLNNRFGIDGATWEDGDFDGDGRVTFGDFLILSSNFGPSE